MDFIRSCYTAKMRFWVEGQVEEVEVEWYRPPEGAELLGKKTPFMSSVWRPDPDLAEGELGEVRAGHTWANGETPEDLNVGIPCGPDAAWEGKPGNYPPLPKGSDGLSLCCQAIELTIQVEPWVCMASIINHTTSGGGMNYGPAEAFPCSGLPP